MSAKPMTATQRHVLRMLTHGFPGYCELMARAGLRSYKSVDWVLDALARRGYVNPDDEYLITDAGRAALTEVRP
jgi:LexA DNA binding domain